MAAHGRFAWNELLSTHPAAAMRFYEATLGWTFESFPLGDAPYWVIKSGDEMIGGLGGLDAGDAPAEATYWLTTIAVDDIDRRYEEALKLGATEVRAPHDVPNIGRVAVLRDPTGGLVCWISAG
jgi:predicted enzyme related to lactoylglutathione lyase